jgi:hypothetical protein
MLTETVNRRAISAKIDFNDVNLIKSFLQGAVYCWCKNCKTEEQTPKWFAARDILGGDNYYWEKTPLIKLYQWHDDNGASDPINMAGRDAGHLLLDVIADDKRIFNTREGYTREYQWTGEK